MAEILSPGVFMEEVPSAIQVVQPVSTSNMGIVGATKRGPDNKATLVTSFEQFTRIFGEIIAESRTGLSMAAYFQNGGKRSFVVRVMPSDADKADGYVSSARRDFECNVGDGVTAAITQAVLSPSSLITPIASMAGVSGVGFRWRSDDIDFGSNNTFVFAAGIVTLTSNEALFTASMVGKQITIAGATSAPNDGSYVIATYVSPTVVTYANALGVSEVGIGAWLVDLAAEDNLFQRDGATVLVQDTVGHPLDGASTAHYEGRVITFLPTDGVDSSLPSVTPGGVLTLHWIDSASAAATLSLAQVGTTMRATGVSGAGSVAELDLITGFLTITFAGVDVPVVADDGANIQLTYQPMTTVRSVADDGNGVLVDDLSGTLTGPGTIAYVNAAVPPPNAGDYAFTTDAGYEPGTGCPVLCSYDIQVWTMDPSSVGVWGADMRIDVSGNDDYYDVVTDTYTRYNINILLLNSATGLFDILETYEEITFTDATSAQYFPDVVNDLSDLLDVVEPALNSEGPADLDGSARSQIVAGGDELAGNRQIDATLLDSPVRVRTFSLSYTDDTGAIKTVTDDGSGNLIGDVDASGNNTIDYTTGVIDLLVSDEIGQDQLVSATYRSESEVDSHRDVFTGGSDGTFTNPSFYGRSQFTSPVLEPNYFGVYALSRIEELMQVVIPDFAGDVQITKDLLDYAAGRQSLPSGGDRFIILVVPQGSDAQEAVDFLRIDIAQYTAFAAMYWPWVKVADPLADNRPVVFPPLGHIAGIYARTDSQRNVGKAPGGTVDGALRFLVGLESDTTQGERDIVYPSRINPLVSGPQTGLAVWGVRTISLQSEWRYIQVRRLFMFVEKSIYNSTHWIVFESNGPALWTRIKAQIQSFLNGIFSDGLLAGTTPAQAFFVIVDETNNTPATIDAGQVLIDVGIAPNKPAEFTRFRLSQKTLDS